MADLAGFAGSGGAATAAPGVVVARPGRASERLSLGGVLFLAGFVVYLGFALAVLGAGVLAAAAGDTGLHDTLHERAFQPGLVGRFAGAVADASHRAEPLPQLALDYGFSLFNLTLAVLLVWLRARDRTARLLALALVGSAATLNLQAYSVYEALSPTRLETAAHIGFHLIAAVSYVLALLLFPDGRLIPRWPRAAQATLYAAAAAAVVAVAVRIDGTSRTLVLVMVFGLLTPAVGVVSQAYRYRRSPTSVERQQSRLLFWALAPALLLGLFVLTRGIAGSAFSGYEGRQIEVIPTALFRLFQPVFGIIPVALFVGILRFRLWNIDRVISRTLAYGSLAAFVSAVYIAVVVGLGQTIGSRGDVWLSIVATGVVAVAFQPVRERVQRVANRLVYGARLTPYEVVATFSERLTHEPDTHTKLECMARLLAQSTGAVRAEVWLVVGGQLRREAVWPAQEDAPASLPLSGDMPALPDVTAYVPVRHEGELLGALAVVKPVAESVSPAEEKLLADLAAQAGLVLRNVRLNAELLNRLEELRASRQRLVTAQDDERRRLERNLHDGAQQELVAIKVRLGLAERMAQQGRPVADTLAQLKDATGDAIDNLRALARGIYPPLLASDGLAAALAAQAAKSPLPVEVRDDGVGRLRQEVEAAAYFCCLEAMQNASKYAEASKVVVSLARADGRLVFAIADDGHGFDPRHVRCGAGTQNMRDRVEALDGTLEISSAVGAGTTVAGTIPCAAVATG